jgi:serine protease inhibitor
MNKTLGTLIAAALILTIVGCTDNKTVTPEHTAQAVQSNTEAVAPAVSSSDVNQFGTISSLDTSSVGSVEVVCHNCQAHFKLSQQIQKMSMKGDAIVDCPVCHKNYLGK